MASARGLCHRGPRRAPSSRPAWPRTALALLMLAGMASVPAARAADAEVERLQREVAALKDSVLRLQARVDRLESPARLAGSPLAVMPPPVPPAAPVAPLAALEPGADPAAATPQAQLRANWSKIEPGMASDDVSRLLGEPTRKLRLDGRTAWYFSYPALGNGSVFFTDTGRVSSRQSPFGWGG